MPYRIRKAPNRDLYWVVGEDGKHHSKDPIPLATAKKQMAALHIAMKGGEYPVPEPRGPMYFDTVEKTAYNQKQADEYKSMDSDPRRRDLWNKAQKRLGRTATDKDYAAHRALANEVAKKRVAANPTYTPKELAEEKKRDYEQQKWQEDYKNWKKGADAYYAQHPGEQLVIPPLNEKSEKITLSREEWRKLPKITQAEAKRRLEVYKERNKSGWQKFSESLANTMAGLTDSAVGLISDLVPGGKALEVGYKSFAPPGSEFYKEGSVQDKFGNLPENIASAVGAGRKKRRMRGGRWETTKLGASLAATIGTPMFWIGLGQASPVGPGLIFGAVAQAILLMGAGYFNDLALRRVEEINRMAAAPAAAAGAPVVVIANVMRNIQAVIRAYELPTGPSTGTYTFPPDSMDLNGFPLDAGPAYLVTPLPAGRRGVPQRDDFLSPEGAATQVRFQVNQTRPEDAPFRGPLIHPLRDTPMTLVPVTIRIEDTVVDVAPAAPAADHVAITVKPEGSGRRRRGGMKHLTLDRPPKPGKKPITVAHPEDAAKIVRAPFAQSVSASEIGKYFGKKGVKAATKMTESVYVPHPPHSLPPAPPAGPPPARKRPTIPAAAKPDHDWWVRDELAHDPSGKSLLALRALTTPGIASIVRSFTAPTADMGSHLGPLPMRPATKDEMVHRLWLDMIRSEVFSDNDAKEGMARAYYGPYWDMDWDEDHESSEDEGTEVNREAREAERRTARGDRWTEFLDRRQDDLEDLILSLGREGYHGEAEEPSDPDFWDFAFQDLARAWNTGLFNRKIKELRFKYSLRPEQAAAVKAGIREELEALRDKAAEDESSESEGEAAPWAPSAAALAEAADVRRHQAAAAEAPFLTRAEIADAERHASSARSYNAAVAHREALAALAAPAAAASAVDESSGRGRGGRVGGRKIHKGHIMIGGALPTNNILHQMAVAAYAPNPPSNVEGYVLIKSTPGLKFYKAPTDPEIVVAIKGTDDWKDIKADVQIGYHSLANSARLKEDVETLNDFQEQYPQKDYTYYGVGHSLGGAILDEFLKMGLVKKGVSYNPAIQPGDIRRTDIDNHRIYKQGDFLYKLMGQFSMSPEVRAKSMTAYVGSFLNPLDPFTSHTLDNFEGGSKPTSKFQNQLKRAKVSPAAYLAAAKEKAKKKGLAWKHIGFSSDDTHKLQVPNAEGKLVRFGSVGQGDHVLYTLSHDKSADEHRKRYLARATKIKGNWKADEYSPNSLAIAVLW